MYSPTLASLPGENIGAAMALVSGETSMMGCSISLTYFCKRLIHTPSRASLTAGSMIFSNGRRQWALCTTNKPATTPGTAIEPIPM